MPTDKHTLLSSKLLTEIDALLGVSHQQHVIEDNEITYPTRGFAWHLSLPKNNDEAMRMMDYCVDHVRHVLGSQSLQAYKQIDSWWGLHKTPAHTLVVFPGISQYDIVRFAWDLPPGSSDAEAHIVTLKHLHQTYGIDIIGAGHRTIEFRLQQQLTERRRIRFLNRLLHFCPDIMQAFPHWESDEELLVDSGSSFVFNHNYFDISDGRIALWWD
ncbi:MAG: DUF4253 domain-containing protein [Chloroflexota bacterium]